jgi:mycoredoxin-dependent peroxiredoxin
MTVEIGQPAPDFTRTSHTGDEISLSALRGTPVVLVFIPFAFTGVCEGELCAIRDDPAPFEAGGARVIAISCNAGPTLKRWAADNGFTFDLVSDFWPHGEIATAYGAFNDKLGCANRVSVVIDAEGTVVDRFETENLGTARSAERYQEAMVKL